MKFGVDAPWYQDDVECLAFNLYAIDCEEKKKNKEKEGEDKKNEC